MFKAGSVITARQIYFSLMRLSYWRSANSAGTDLFTVKILHLENSNQSCQRYTHLIYLHSFCGKIDCQFSLFIYNYFQIEKNAILAFAFASNIKKAA